MHNERWTGAPAPLLHGILRSSVRYAALFIGLIAIAVLQGTPARAQTAVLQRGYDAGVSGATLGETTLKEVKEIPVGPYSDPPGPIRPAKGAKLVLAIVVWKNNTKESSSNFRWFVDRNGGDGTVYELEALNPEDMLHDLEKVIQSVIDVDLFNREARAEQ